MKYIFVGVFGVMGLLTIVAWVWQPRDADDGRIELVWISDDNPVRREQIRLFNELYPQYRLRLDPHNAGLEKTIVQCLAGVGPDLFDCYFGFQRMVFVRSGIALDVTDAWADRGMDLDASWPCLAPLFIHDGRPYGHPDNAYAPAVWYNKTVFDKAGVPYPTADWTWQDLIAIGKQLTIRDEHGRP